MRSKADQISANRTVSYAMSNNGLLRFSEVTDGLSQTAYMAEKLIWLREKAGIPTIAEGRQDPLRFPWETLEHFVRGQEDAFARHCLSETVRSEVAERGSGYSNSLAESTHRYDHLLPPNCWSFSNANSDPDDGGRVDGGAWTISCLSFHGRRWFRSQSAQRPSRRCFGGPYLPKPFEQWKPLLHTPKSTNICQGRRFAFSLYAAHRWAVVLSLPGNCWLVQVRNEMVRSSSKNKYGYRMFPEPTVFASCSTKLFANPMVSETPRSH